MDASALLDLSRQRAEIIGGYMPAGADLVVNLARGSFLEHVNTGLSSENFGLYARGGICRKSRRAFALSSHAERASAATSRSDSGYRDLLPFPSRRA